MTYAQQLKDYENAVIQKRFEELSEEEVRSLAEKCFPECVLVETEALALCFTDRMHLVHTR